MYIVFDPPCFWFGVRAFRKDGLLNYLYSYLPAQKRVRGKLNKRIGYYLRLTAKLVGYAAYSTALRRNGL